MEEESLIDYVKGTEVRNHNIGLNKKIDEIVGEGINFTYDLEKSGDMQYLDDLLASQNQVYKALKLKVEGEERWAQHYSKVQGDVSYAFSLLPDFFSTTLIVALQKITDAFAWLLGKPSSASGFQQRIQKLEENMLHTQEEYQRFDKGIYIIEDMLKKSPKQKERLDKIYDVHATIKMSFRRLSNAFKIQEEYWQYLMHLSYPDSKNL